MGGEQVATARQKKELGQWIKKYEPWELFEELMKTAVVGDEEPITLEKNQKQIWKDSLDEKIRRQYILAHRGYGKSWLEGAHRFISMLTTPGWQSYTIYPKMDQAKYSLRYTKDFITMSPYTDWLKKKALNWGEQQISLHNHSVSFVISPSSRTATGYHVNQGYVGEAARWADEWDEIFYSAIVPMTNRKEGLIWATSSAYGERGFFYNEHKKDENETRKKYTLSIDDTDVYTSEDKSTFYDDLGTVLYQQEYGCQFVGSAETFIQQYIINKQTRQMPRISWVDVVTGTDKVDYLGLDPGKNFDKFGICGLKRVGKGRFEAQLYEELQIDGYGEMLDQIKQAQKLNPKMNIFMESTGNQIMYLDWLRTEGVRVEGYEFGNTKKQEAYQRLERYLRNANIYLPHDNELCMTQLKYIPYKMRGTHIHFPDENLGGHHTLHALVVIDLGVGSGGFQLRSF